MSNENQAKAPARPPLSRFRVHGDTAYISGQVPIKDGAIVGDEIVAQTQQTLANVRAAVEAAGSSLANILKCNCYLRRESDIPEFNRVYREFFGDVELPARTTLVATPPNPKVLVEVEAIAALGLAPKQK
jgi:2-iminobutanoate/2-iminopropanoate deaminase